MSKKAQPVDDIIETVRLPAICPKCGTYPLTVARRYEIHRVACGCGWTAKYALTPEVR